MSTSTQRLPKPEPVRHAGHPKWPWATMKVGEMFFVPDKERNTMTALAWSSGKRLGRKFSTRMVHMRKGQIVDGTINYKVKPTLGIGVWRDA